LAEELESHLQMHIEDNLRSGMNPAAARRQALIKLGGIDQTKENYRDRRGIPMLETLLQDVRYALRMLRRIPGSPPLPCSRLHLESEQPRIGFSVIYAVLINPYPYEGADRIVHLHVFDKTAFLLTCLSLANNSGSFNKPTRWMVPLRWTDGICPDWYRPTRVRHRRKTISECLPFFWSALRC